MKFHCGLGTKLTLSAKTKEGSSWSIALQVASSSIAFGQMVMFSLIVIALVEPKAAIAANAAYMQGQEEVNHVSLISPWGS